MFSKMIIIAVALMSLNVAQANTRDTRQAVPASNTEITSTHSILKKNMADDKKTDAKPKGEFEQESVVFLAQGMSGFIGF